MFIKGLMSGGMINAEPKPGREMTPMREQRACADFYRSPLSRRQMIQVGPLGTLGLSVPAALRAEAGSGRKVRAKSVMFLRQFGGPAHLDTFDIKPDAPAEL